MREVGIVTEAGGRSCRLEPEGLAVRGVILRWTLEGDAPGVVRRLGPEGSWIDVPAEVYADRGYVQVIVDTFGVFRFDPS